MNVIEMATRDRLLTVRMSPEEIGQLEELSRLRRLSSSDLVRTLVHNELGRAKREEEAERRVRSRYWEQDKDRLKQLVIVAGLKGGAWSFNDADRTCTFTRDGQTIGPSVVGEFETSLIGFPGSRIVCWSPADMHTPMVAKTAAAAARALAKIKELYDGDTTDLTPARLAKLGLVEASLD